jgi:hypothetical protein
MSSQQTAAFRLSAASNSQFESENPGDILLVPGSATQKLLFGTSQGVMPVLAVGSNFANVGGYLNAGTVSTGLLQTSQWGLNMTLWDPTLSNGLMVVEPQNNYVSDPLLASQAFGICTLSNGSNIFTSPSTFSNLTVSGSVMPTADSVVDLGGPSSRFRSLYVSGNTIYLGSNAISADSLNGTMSFVNVTTGAPVRMVVNELQVGRSSNATVISVTESGLQFTASNSLSSASNSGTVSFASNVSIGGHLMPTVASTQNIGSSNVPFKAAWIDTLHLATNTLYLGDTPVLGTTADTVLVRADSNQSITVQTTGTGLTTLTSYAGVSLTAQGINSAVSVNATGAGGQVNFGATTSVGFTAPSIAFNGNVTAHNDVTISGNLTVNGSNFIANTHTVEVEDNILMLNRGQTGSTVSAGSAGISIFRGDGAAYQLLYVEASQCMQAGPIGQTVPLATQAWATSNLGSGTFSNTVTILNSAGTSNTVALTVSGGIQATGDVSALSDARVKSDLLAIPDALAKVSTLTGYTFSRTDDLIPGGRRYMGLIAQDVQTVAPELVHADRDGQLTLAYGNVSALLVQAVNELSRKLEALSVRLDGLAGAGGI